MCYGFDPMNTDLPSYGSLDHYVGEKGKKYFEWQQGQDGLTEARYNLHIWRPHIAREDSVLDFGCGGGFLLKVLQTKKAVGVEINPHARETAHKLGIETYASLSEVNDKFDKVISSHALEHVPHPRQAILELKDKLRDGGKMVFLLPLDDWRTSSNRHYFPGDINQHLHAWTPLTLGNLIASCGLRVERVDIITHAWPPNHRQLWDRSPRLFHAVAWWWSVKNKQRQLFAMATR
jgi:SAM-dependent methyltransferase